MAPLTLAAGDAVVVVDPEQGGRLLSWQVGDLELLGARGDAPQEFGCYPMAPWAGRVRDNVVRVDGRDHPLPPTFGEWAIHGTVLDRPWQVEVADPAHVRLSIDLVAPWPWEGRVVLTWGVEQGALRSAIAVESAGDEFPAVVGWHPWFRRSLLRGGAVQRRMAAAGLLERGPDHLPTGRLLDPAGHPGPYDDAFVVPDGRVELVWPGALALRCRSDAGWVVVFDELDDWVCVEPQSGPPDGLGDGARQVRPDRPLVVTAAWTWRHDTG